MSADLHTRLALDLIGEGFSAVQAATILTKAASLALKIANENDVDAKRRSHMTVIDEVLSRYEGS